MTTDFFVDFEADFQASSVGSAHIESVPPSIFTQASLQRIVSSTSGLRETIRLLSPRQRRQFVSYQAFFLVAGFLQVVGAGSVAPFVVLLSKPTVLTSNPIAKALYDWAGFSSEIQAITAFACVMIAAIVVSNVMAALSVWVTFRFSLNLGAELQHDLLKSYFARPYERLAGVNSADLINKIAVGAPRFAFNVMQPVMTIASQGAIVFVIVVGLLAYKPSVVLSFVALIGLGYGVLFLVVRTQLVHHGLIIWRGGERRQRLLTEGLGAIKEIRLSNSEATYQKSYRDESEKIYRSEAIVGVLADVPRFLLESVAFSALLLIAILQLRGGASRESVIATLSVFAMTSYRLLPAGQAIFKSISQIRANSPVISELLPDLDEGRRSEVGSANESYKSVPDYPAELTLRDVCFTYSQTQTAVLDGINVTVPLNALTVIVGASGSGKSTLSDLLLGLLKPTSGTVSVGSIDLREIGPNWYGAVGYVPQEIFLLDESIRRNVAFGSIGPVNEERLVRALKLAHLWTLIESVPEGLNYVVGENGSRLSGGQRQRMGIARALYRDAHYLILDEATSALDGRTEADVIATLHQLRTNRTVLMIAHRLTTIMAADHIIFLREGRVEATGSFDELQRSCEAFRTLVASNTTGSANGLIGSAQAAAPR